MAKRRFRGTVGSRGGRTLPSTGAIALAIASVALAITPAAHAQPDTSSAAGGIQAEPQTTLPDIEDEVMCPVCGTTLELATESVQANRERDYIRGLIAQGQTKEEIKDRLVAEFGEEILATPSTDGFDLMAWLVPGLAILIAGGGIFFGLRRWRAAGAAAGEGQGAAVPAEDAEEGRRLDADLERYGL